MGGRLIPEDEYEFEPPPDPEDPYAWIDDIATYEEGFADVYEIGVWGRTPLRPTWDEYFMGAARWAATRSDCERDKVGAVIVDKDNRVRISGYNGAPKGSPGCDTCPRRTSGCAPGSPYDSDVGRCVAVHAEMNALLWAKEDLTDTTMYVTREPCYECSKNIAGAGIRRVVWPGGVIER